MTRDELIARLESLAHELENGGTRHEHAVAAFLFCVSGAMQITQEEALLIQCFLWMKAIKHIIDNNPERN